MRQRRFMVAACLAVSLGLVPTSVAGASGVSTGSTPLTWLAAGDSYAAGQGVTHTTGAPCRQAIGASKAWAEVAVEDLRKDSFDVAAPHLVACSGARTGDFFASQGTDPAQWKKSMGTFNIVSFSFGGDNVKFDTVMTACVSRHIHPDCTEAYVRHQIHKLGLQYPHFLLHVAETAVTSGGVMVVMGYPELVEKPNLWPHVDRLFHICEGFTEGIANQIRGWAGDLNATIGSAVKDFDAKPSGTRKGVTAVFIDPVSGNNGVSPSSPNLFEPASGVRHELCSKDDESWLNGIDPDRHREFHPNQEGETAMGNLVVQVLPKLLKKLLAPPAPSSATLAPTYPIYGSGGSYCSVTPSGHVDCWPNGSSPTVWEVPTVTGVASLASPGGGEYCALLSTGDVDCWTIGGSVSTEPISDVSYLDANSDFCAALKSGKVECWTLGTTPVAVPMPTNSGVVSMTGGGEGYCAVLKTGHVACWGNGTSFLGQASSPTPPPAIVPNITNAAIVGSAGLGDGYCAIEKTGHVECWGSGTTGALGDGSTNSSNVPVQVNGITNAVTMPNLGGRGYLDYCVVLSTGAVDCWGSGADGQLGDGKTTTSSTPVQVQGVSTAVSITENHGSPGFCALLRGGGVDCWGSSTGIGDVGFASESALTAQPVAGLSTVADLVSTYASGGGFCARTSAGAVECWGSDNAGQLGPEAHGTSSAVPETVPLTP